ncbi:VOC family protein [Caulobacter sp.]|uniref:VOC family protein n=1 Tax=Caulobacter sp. TaxID=78 RepID=UPI002B49998F|nr:VOC family protein [Caulobacter sp.]HJV42160.1 VOC family protein [Caulobacter sp.]
MRGLTPYFEVFDMNASLAFYRDQLGFEVLFASPEVQTAEGRFSHFVHLARDGAELMLNTAYDSNERPAQRSEPRWQGCRHTALYIACDDVVGMQAEITAKGLNAPTPATTGYGFLAFSISDPDGHGVVFQQPGSAALA